LLASGRTWVHVKGDWERYSFYFQLLDEIRIREEFQIRTFGTKREGDVRYDVPLLIANQLISVNWKI